MKLSLDRQKRALQLGFLWVQPFEASQKKTCYLICVQDTTSRSAVVRFYYRHRLFMGFCCICCEVLYLALYLLHFERYQSWPAVQLPRSFQGHLNGAHLRLSSCL